MPVLITAGLSPEAHRLKRTLNISDVVFADESLLPHIPGSQSAIIPSSASASFVHEVLKTCLDLSITKVYPLKRGEVIELSKARSLFLEYDITLIIPSDDWLKKNMHIIKSSADNIIVMENGELTAGAAIPDSIFIKKETGIFVWATKRQKTEYCLYLIDDAGI